MATQKKFVVKNGLTSQGNVDVTGNLVISGTVDGRDIATDGTKLDNVAVGATAYGDSNVASYLGSNGYGTSSSILASITDSAPGTLDTLNELAAALGDDANFSTTVTNSIANKLPLAGGTITGDVSFTNGNKAVFGGTGNGELEIYAHATNNNVYISENGGSGNLNLGADNFNIYTNAFTKQVASFTAGSAKLLNDGNEKLATTSTGIDVTGNASFANNGKAIFGASNNLQIFSTGTSSYVAESGSGDLYIKGSSIYLTDTDNNQYIHLSDTGTGGTVVLKHNAVTKLATSATGIDVTGNATFADNGKAIFGAGSDLEVYHNGTDSRIAHTGTGHLVLSADNFRLRNNALSQDLMQVNAGGNILLYHNGALKFATTSTGIDVTGNVSLADGGRATFGTGDDLQIYHTGGTSVINDTGTGRLFIGGSPGVDIGTPEVDEYYIRAYNDGAVELYYDNAKKLETTSTGIGVTGDVAATNVNATTVNATTVDLGDWTITEASGSLLFATQGVTKMKLDSSGNLDVVGNINSSAYIYSAAALIVNGKTPPLAFDFVNSYFRNSGNDSTFANSLTFTRASAATMTSSSGLVVTVANGVNRLGHHIYNSTSNSWVNSGILIESEARTNYVQDSHLQDTNNGMGTFITTRAVFTENNAVSPDGTTNAAKFAGDGSNNSHKANIYVQGSGTSPGLTDTATFSVYLKQGTHRYAQVEVMDNAADTNGGLNRLFINIDLQTGTILGTLEVGSPTNPNARIENVGNGWYRASATLTKKGDNVRTDGGVQFSNAGAANINPTTTSGADDYFYVWGAQLEAGQCVSSLIPTSGGVITRAAELLTVAAAKLPSVVTTPIEVSGTEILTNSGFDTDTDWTKGTGYSIANGVATKAVGTASGSFYQEGTFTATPGKMYKAELDVTVGQSSSGAIIVQMWGGGGGDTDSTHTGVYGTGYVNTGSTGTYTWYIIPTINRSRVGLISTGGWDGTINSFSLKEVEPYAISSHMKGTLNYNDFGNPAAVAFWIRQPYSTTYMHLKLSTQTGRQGQVGGLWRNGSTLPSSTGPDSSYYPGINVPYNISIRHTAAYTQLAVDGTSMAAGNNTSTNPHVGLPALSGIDLQIAETYMGTIDTFTMWGEDIGATGSESITI